MTDADTVRASIPIDDFPKTKADIERLVVEALTRGIGRLTFAQTDRVNLLYGPKGLLLIVTPLDEVSEETMLKRSRTLAMLVAGCLGSLSFDGGRTQPFDGGAFDEGVKSPHLGEGQPPSATHRWRGAIVWPLPPAGEAPALKRNEPCRCGSGKKAKRCCLR